MKRFCALLLLAYPFIAGYVQAFTFSKNSEENEATAVHKLTETDEVQITQLRDQVLKLQEAVTEITRSFSTLELAVKDLAKMKTLVESPNSRIERDVDKQSPQSPKSSSSDDKPTDSDPSPTSDGLFTWPMLSDQCPTCPAGAPGPVGPIGPPGPQGIMGRDGRDGRDAVTHPEEPHCDPTSPPDIQPVFNSSQSGVVYIRWGSKECPEKAELIYKGTVGGAFFEHTGSGANYLCMPDEPIYDETVTSPDDKRARLCSSEYQTHDGPSRLQPMKDHTPTCAVCKAPSGRTTKVMIPARNVCPSADWRLEYAGYLMAGKYTHQKAEYVCVDRGMDFEPGTHGNQDGALLYMVEGRCLTGGGLPCGPYVHGYELTCAVCTI